MNVLNSLAVRFAQTDKPDSLLDSLLDDLVVQSERRVLREILNEIKEEDYKTASDVEGAINNRLDE